MTDRIEAIVAKMRADLTAVGGFDNELVAIPAGGVRSMIERLEAALATQSPPKDFVLVPKAPLESARAALDQIGKAKTEMAEAAARQGAQVACFYSMQQILSALAAPPAQPAERVLMVRYDRYWHESERGKMPEDHPGDCEYAWFVREPK